VKKAIVLFYIFIFCQVGFSVAYTWNGGTGNWNVAGNWTPSAVPGTGDDVTINAGACTLDVVFTTGNRLNSLTIGGGTFYLNSYNLYLTGSITMTGGTLQSSGATTSILTIGGDLSITNASFNMYNGSGATLTVVGNTTVTGVNTDAFRLSGQEAHFNGNFSITGVNFYKIDANVYFDGNTDSTISNNADGAYNNWNTIYIAKTGTAKAVLNTNLTLSAGNTNNLYLNSGTLDLNGYNLTINGAFTFNSAAILRLKGSETLSAAVTQAKIISGGTVDYYSAYAGALKFPSYNNLIIEDGTRTVSGNSSIGGILQTYSGSQFNLTGTQTLTVTGTTNNAGSINSINGGLSFSGLVTNSGTISTTGSSNFTFTNGITTSGTVTGNTGTISVTTGGISGAGTFTCGSGALTVLNNGGVTVTNFGESSTTSTVDGAFTVSNFTSNSGTVVLTNTANLAISTSGSFNNLTVSTGVRTMTGTINVGGNLIIDSTLQTGNNALTITGYARNTSSNRTNSGTLICGNSAVSIGGNCILNTLTGANANISIDGNCILSNGTGAGSGFTTRVGGNFDVLTYTNNSGTLIFNNTSGSTITSNSNAMGIVQFSQNKTFSGSFSCIDITIDDGVTLTDNGNTINISGNWTNNNAVSGNGLTATGAINFNGTGTSTITGSTNFNNFSCAVAGKQLTFQNSTTQVIGGTLTLTGSGLPSNTVKLRSDLSGTQWNIQVNGSTSVSYVDVEDSNVSESSSTSITANTSINFGNNDDTSGMHWIFGPNNITWSATAVSQVWASATNWDLGYVPNDTDNIIIPASTNNPILGAARQAASITIQNGGVLFTHGSQLTVTGLFDLQTGGTIYVYGTETLAFGSITNNGTFIYEGTVSSNLHLSKYYNLTISASSGTPIFSALGTESTVISGALSITSGTLLLNASYDMDVSGNISITGGTLNANSRTINLAGSWSNTGSGIFTCSGSTLNFNGTAAQTIISGGNGAGKRFNNIQLNTTSTVTLLTNDIAQETGGILTISNANTILNLNALSWNLGFAFTMSQGTLQIPDGSTFYGQDINTAATYYDTTFNGTSIVTIGNTGITVGKAISISGGASSQFACTGNSTINCYGNFNLTLSGAGWIIGSSTIHLYSATSATADIRKSVYNLIVENNANYQMLYSVFDLYGDLYIDATSTFDLITSSVVTTFMGTKATHNLTTGGKTFYSIVINKSSGTLLFNDDVALTKDFLVAAGTVDLTTNSCNVTFSGTNTETFNPGATVQNFYSVTINKTAGTLSLSNNLRLIKDFIVLAATPAGTLSVGTRSITFSGGNSEDFNPGINLQIYYDIILNKTSGTIVSLQDPLTLTHSLTITSGTLNVNTSTNQITIDGTVAGSSFTIDSTNGDFTHSNGKVLFSGNQDQTFNSGAKDFYDIEINKNTTAKVTLITNNLNQATGGIFTMTNGIFDMATFTFTLGSSPSLTGGELRVNTGSLNASSGPYSIIIAGTSVTVYDLNTNGNIRSGDLTITGGSLNASYGASKNGLIIVNGSWTDNSLFTCGLSTVRFIGTGNINAGSNFYTVSIRSSGTVSQNSSVTCNNYFGLYQGTFNINTGFTLYSAGDFVAIGANNIDSNAIDGWGNTTSPTGTPVTLYDTTGLTVTFPSGSFSGIFQTTGTSILRVNGNFYNNGCSMIGSGSQWNLILKDMRDETVRNARAYGNITVSYSNVTCSDASPARAVIAAAETSQALPDGSDGGSNTGWYFNKNRTYVSGAETAVTHDNIIKVIFSNNIPVINSNITNAITDNLSYNNSTTKRFSGAYQDESFTAISSSYITTIYFALAAGDTYNTDATGSSAGTGTDRSGTNSTIIPDILFIPYQSGNLTPLRDENKNQIYSSISSNTNVNGSTTSVPQNRYSATVDKCKPVIVSVSFDIDDDRATTFAYSPYYTYYTGTGSDPGAGPPYNFSMGTISAAASYTYHNVLKIIFSEYLKNSAGSVQYDTTNIPIESGSHLFAANTKSGNISGSFGDSQKNTGSGNEDVIGLGEIVGAQFDVDNGYNYIKFSDAQTLDIHIAGWYDGSQFPGYINTVYNSSTCNPVNWTSFITIANSNALDSQGNSLGANGNITITHTKEWDFVPPDFRYIASTVLYKGDPYENVAAPYVLSTLACGITDGSPLINRVEFAMTEAIRDPISTYWDMSGSFNFSFYTSGTKDTINSVSNLTFTTNINSIGDLINQYNDGPANDGDPNDQGFAITFTSVSGKDENTKVAWTYSGAGNKLVDLRGNKVQAITTEKLSLDFAAPYILETRAVPGTNKMYVEFNKAVYHDPGKIEIQPGDFEFRDKNSNLLGTYSVAGIQNTGTGKYIFTLNQTLDQNNIVDYTINAIANTIRPNYSRYMNDSIYYKLSYIGINFFVNMTMEDYIHQGQDWKISVFNGDEKVSPDSMKVTATVLNVTSFSGIKPILYYDTLDTHSLSKFWYPNLNKNSKMVVGTNKGDNVWEFIIPSSDDKIKSGKELSFVFKYGSLYCYRGPNSIGASNFSPYDAETHMVKLQNIQLQNNDVTILNNVINPNNSEITKLIYTLQKTGPVSIVVYDLAGDVVKVIVMGSQNAGQHIINWDGKNENGKIVTRGVYFIRVRAPGIFNQIRKVLIVK
jgi:hypothetical protein